MFLPPELSAKEVDPGQVERILFPVNVETSEELGSAQTEIPVELLNERGAESEFDLLIL